MYLYFCLNRNRKERNAINTTRRGPEKLSSKNQHANANPLKRNKQQQNKNSVSVRLLVLGLPVVAGLLEVLENVVPHVRLGEDELPEEAVIVCLCRKALIQGSCAHPARQRRRHRHPHRHQQAKAANEPTQWLSFPPAVFTDRLYSIFGRGAQERQHKFPTLFVVNTMFSKIY